MSAIALAQSLETRLSPSDERTRSRQNDPKFGELTGLRIDLYRPTMLLDDDVMANGQAKARAFSGRLGRKERIEDLLLHLRRNAGAVVADSDFDGRDPCGSPQPTRANAAQFSSIEIA